MSTPRLKLAAFFAGVVLAVVGGGAQAHHFRGAALVPSVSASGLLTVVATSFWKNVGPGVIADVDDLDNIGDQGNPIQVAELSGPATFSGSMVHQPGTTGNTSDPRYERTVSTFTLQLPRAGTYDITAGDYFKSTRTNGAVNIPADSIWSMESTIFWNGTAANTPILFSLAGVNPTVTRNVAYSGSLGATTGNGGALSYDQVLNDDISAQPTPNFKIDPVTGAMTIPKAETLTIPDNTQGDIGADAAFSGDINNSDGSFVQFEWLFDAVDTNAAPTISTDPIVTTADPIINALVGASLSKTLFAIDDGLPNPPGTLTWSDLGLTTPLGTCTNTPTFNVLTHVFSWNTANCLARSYIYQVSVSDSALSDDATITINLSAVPSGGAVPEPATLALMVLGVLGLAGLQRRRGA